MEDPKTLLKILEEIDAGLFERRNDHVLRSRNLVVSYGFCVILGGSFYLLWQWREVWMFPYLISSMLVVLGLWVRRTQNLLLSGLQEAENLGILIQAGRDLHFRVSRGEAPRKPEVLFEFLRQNPSFLLTFPKVAVELRQLLGIKEDKSTPAA